MQQFGGGRRSAPDNYELLVFVLDIDSRDKEPDGGRLQTTPRGYKRSRPAKKKGGKRGGRKRLEAILNEWPRGHISLVEPEGRIFHIRRPGRGTSFRHWKRQPPPGVFAKEKVELR